MAGANGTNPFTSLLSSVASGDVSRAASALGQIAVQRVTLESQFLPPISFEPTYDSSGAPVQASPINPLSWVRPKLTVTPLVGPPVVYAPYGEPTGNYLPYLVGAGAGGLALYALARGRSYAKTAGLVALGALALGYMSSAAPAPAPAPGGQ